MYNLDYKEMKAARCSSKDLRTTSPGRVGLDLVEDWLWLEGGWGFGGEGGGGTNEGDSMEL